jgi:hypothetical protein
MSAYNAPTETLPRFNTAVFIQDANVTYPVAQGALTIPKKITIVDGSNTIIITPTSIIINGIVYNLSNIAYLNLSQTFTGVNTFSNSILTNTINGLLATDNISLYSTTTGTITLGSTSSTNTINGNTTFTNTLSALTPTSQLNTTRVPTTAYLTTYYPSLSSNNTLSGTNTFTNTLLCNTITGRAIGDAISLYGTSTGTITLGSTSSTNTINGNTTITNTLLGNTLTGKAVGDAISLYNTSTGLITFGNSTLGTNTNTIYGITTFNQALNAPTPASQINNTQVPTTAYLTTYYAPLTGTIANATAITLTPNTTDTADYIPFSSTASGSSNLKTSTVLLYNASTGNLSSTIHTTNTLQGQAISSAISLYTTSTSGGITLGNSSNTNTINGATTFNQNITFNSQINGIGTTDFSNIPKIATMYQAFGGNSPSGFPTYDVTYNTTLFPNSFRVYGAFTTDYIYYANAKISNQQNLFVNDVNFNKINFLQICINANGSGTVAGVNSIAGIDFTTWGGRTNAGCRIYAQDSNNYSADLLFVTAPSGSASSNPTERVRIMADGNIGINQSNPQYLLDVNGTGRFVSTLYGNTLQGTTVSSPINLYTNSTSGGITIGNIANTNTINGNTTFTNTIIGNTLQGTTPTTAVNLYTNTTGVLTIGNSSTTAVTGNTNIYGTSTTGVNNLFGNSVSANTTILSNNSSGTIFIGNVAQTGEVKIYGSTSGQSTIYGNVTTGQINMGTALTSGGKIVMGSSAGTITLNGNTTITNTLLGNTLTGKAITDAISLYTTSTSGGITLGNTSNTITLNGNTTITNTLLGNTLTGKAITDAISLYTTSTSGGITLGNTSNTNTINGNTTITNTLLGNTLTGKAITDAISLYTTSTSGGITLGNTSNTNTINGNTTITNTLFGNTLTGKAITDAISLYTTTTGTITLGNSSGAIAIFGITTINNYITTSIFNPIVSTNSSFNMILSNKTGSISGQNNTGLGVGSLSALTTGRDNTAIGTYALNTITDQNYNTAVGSEALGTIVTTGINGGGNTAVGSYAGNALKYGKYNCFFGQLAGTNMNISQADYNTFLGTSTSFITPNTGFSYSTAIGFGAVISASNQIMLGRVNETVVAPNNITITNTLNGNTLAGKTTTDAISLYTTSTSGGITLGNTSNTNTINGNTTITNTLLGNTLTGKAITDAISLYTTTTGTITLGNSSNTNTIRGNTTMPDTLFIDNVNGLFAGDNISLFTTTTTGTMNFVTGLTSGICYIGNLLSTTGQMIIYGAVGGTSTLFSNVVAGAISIGSSLQTGNMTIYGSIGGISNLFTNSVTGTTSILTSNTDGDLNIGNSASNANLNFKWGYMYFTSSYFNFLGPFTVQRDASSLIYAPYDTITYTTTGNQSSPYRKYINCNFSIAGEIMFLRAPSSQLLGMEFVIRFTNVIGSVSTLTTPPVFKNLSNTTTTNLSGSYVVRVVCLAVGSTYYWFQLV